MTDDLEIRLKDSFAAARLPSAPPSLARTLAELSIEPEPARRRRRPWVLATIGVAFLLVAGYLQLILLMGGNTAGAPNGQSVPTPTSTWTSPSPSPTSPAR